ncbi:tRNA-Val4 [Priestia endophytica]|uniref:tRNA-Val4 n=1 Tax=Priestia endophytica TaxID=135735 RepID=UPI002E1EE9E5|nr:tRNA-Val4 [Priestia endophytica]
MKCLYEFYRDHLDILRIKLSDEIELFSDFVKDITTEEEADEYLEYVEKVLDGSYDDLEIQLNATSVFIKKDVSILEHFFKNRESNENTIETEQFKELILIWKSKLLERFKN